VIIHLAFGPVDPFVPPPSSPPSLSQAKITDNLLEEEATGIVDGGEGGVTVKDSHLDLGDGTVFLCIYIHTHTHSHTYTHTHTLTMIPPPQPTPQAFSLQHYCKTMLCKRPVPHYFCVTLPLCHTTSVSSYLCVIHPIHDLTI
jgi:hypothetical protein